MTHAEFALSVYEKVRSDRDAAELMGDAEQRARLARQVHLWAGIAWRSASREGRPDLIPPVEELPDPAAPTQEIMVAALDRAADALLARTKDSDPPEAVVRCLAMIALRDWWEASLALTRALRAMVAADEEERRAA